MERFYSKRKTTAVAAFLGDSAARSLNQNRCCENVTVQHSQSLGSHAAPTCEWYSGIIINSRTEAILKRYQSENPPKFSGQTLFIHRLTPQRGHPALDRSRASPLPTCACWNRSQNTGHSHCTILGHRVDHAVPAAARSKVDKPEILNVRSSSGRRGFLAVGLEP
jgi:hypothetical protein